MSEETREIKRLLDRLHGLGLQIDEAIKKDHVYAVPELAQPFNEYLERAQKVSPAVVAEGMKPFQGTLGGTPMMAVGKLHGLRAEVRRLEQALVEDLPPEE